MTKDELISRKSLLGQIDEIDTYLVYAFEQIEDYLTKMQSVEGFKSMFEEHIEYVYMQTPELEKWVEITSDSGDRWAYQDLLDGLRFFADALSDLPDELVHTYYVFVKDSNWNSFLEPLFRAYLV